jgi:hypothetical protein
MKEQWSCNIVKEQHWNTCLNFEVTTKVISILWLGHQHVLQLMPFTANNNVLCYLRANWNIIRGQGDPTLSVLTMIVVSCNFFILQDLPPKLPVSLILLLYWRMYRSQYSIILNTNKIKTSDYINQVYYCCFSIIYL